MAATKTKPQKETVDLTNAYTVRDVARMLGLKVGTLATWRNQGKGPPYVPLTPRVVLYPRAQYDRWANSQPLKGVN